MISLFVLFCLLSARDTQAQEIDITGTWTMYEMIWSFTGEGQISYPAIKNLHKHGPPHHRGSHEKHRR